MFWKRILLAVLLLLSISYAYEISDYGKQVVVEDYSVIPTQPYPGDIITLAVDLKNRGSYYAVVDVNAVLSLTSEFEPIQTIATVKGINAQSTITVFFKFKVKDSVPYGIYQLPMEVSYLRENTTMQRKDSFNIPVEIHKKVKLSIAEINFEKKLHLKDTWQVEVVVKNTGNAEARNVNIKLSSSNSNLSNFIPLSKTNYYIKTLAANETSKAVFKLYVSEKISPGIYSFTLEASADEASTEKETLNIEVKGRPNIIISGTDFTIEGRRGKKIYPGDIVTIALQLDNIGEETAKAVRVEAEFGKEFVGGKTSYVGNIDADDSGTAIFDITVGKSAKEGAHKIKFKINYLDEEGKEQSLNAETELVIQKMPETPLWILLIEVIVILVIVYFIVKQIFAYLSIRKIKI